MNKSEIVKGIAAESNLSVSEVESVLNSFLEIIGMSLACDEDVKLSGFGKFEARHRKPVTRRNPKTGEAVDVPPKVAVGFVPSPILKDRVNGRISSLRESRS